LPLLAFRRVGHFGTILLLNLPEGRWHGNMGIVSGGPIRVALKWFLLLLMGAGAGMMPMFGAADDQAERDADFAGGDNLET
jgi:hypothetical protein